MLYYLFMSRLLKKMNEYVTVNGMAGKARLSEATNRSVRSVETWLTGKSVPSAQIRYQLAVACGCTHEEALELAQEPQTAKGKAS